MASGSFLQTEMVRCYVKLLRKLGRPHDQQDFSGVINNLVPLGYCVLKKLLAYSLQPFKRKLAPQLEESSCMKTMLSNSELLYSFTALLVHCC